jgi:hypothetical protein
MLSRAIKGGLACPLAVIVAAGLVIAPINSGSVANSPRLVEFSAVRLQAEATTLIAGVVDSTAAKTAAALPGAAAAASATAAATSEPCYYPCTIFDKFLDSLSPEIRSILLPPLIYLFAGVGLVQGVIEAVLAPVLLVTSLVFGWPYELGPAAATRPGGPAGPAEAGEPDDNAATAMQADPDAPAAVPGVPAADEAEGGPVIRGRVAQWTAADSPAEAAVPAPDAPQTTEPQTTEPQTAEPQTAEPQTVDPQNVDPQTAEPGPIEPEVSEQNADAAVATETRPDDAEAVATDLTEMTQPPIASEVAEVAEVAEAAEVEATDATDATAVADEQPTEAATHSATEAPAAAGSTRAAKRSVR